MNTFTNQGFGFCTRHLIKLVFEEDSFGIKNPSVEKVALVHKPASLYAPTYPQQAEKKLGFCMHDNVFQDTSPLEQS